jgi:type II secretory pathway component PulF
MLKPVVAKILTCRVARTLSALLHAGMLPCPSLELTSEAVDHGVLSEYLKTAAQDLLDGHSLGSTMRAIPIFPPMFPAFVTLGEESGRVPELMERAAEIFEQDVELALLDFTRLIEPVMVAFMGFFVAFILIAVFIPLYQIIGSF